MNLDLRLAEVAAAMAEAGLRYLVMGGHAARHYGLLRQTFDFDLHVSLDAALDLPARLSRTRLILGTTPLEGPTWRAADFRRFLLARLPDGREEWLGFWFRNHLLAPFAELHSRREEAEVAGQTVPFMALPDLIRSKETEREDDWQDVALLEEILDLRNLGAGASRAAQMEALAGLRSLRGFRLAEQKGLLADAALVEEALTGASNPLARCYLRPFVPSECPELLAGVPDLIAEPLQSVKPGSGRHLALVEAVRRTYRQTAMAADRADKLRTGQG